MKKEECEKRGVQGLGSQILDWLKAVPSSSSAALFIFHLNAW